MTTRVLLPHLARVGVAGELAFAVEIDAVVDTRLRVLAHEHEVGDGEQRRRGVVRRLPAALLAGDHEPAEGAIDERVVGLQLSVRLQHERRRLRAVAEGIEVVRLLLPVVASRRRDRHALQLVEQRLHARIAGSAAAVRDREGDPRLRGVAEGGALLGQRVGTAEVALPVDRQRVQRVRADVVPRRLDVAGHVEHLAQVLGRRLLDRGIDFVAGALRFAEADHHPGADRRVGVVAGPPAPAAVGVLLVVQPLQRTLDEGRLVDVRCLVGQFLEAEFLAGAVHGEQRHKAADRRLGALVRILLQVAERGVSAGGERRRDFHGQLAGVGTHIRRHVDRLRFRVGHLTSRADGLRRVEGVQRQA